MTDPIRPALFTPPPAPSGEAAAAVDPRRLAEAEAPQARAEVAAMTPSQVQALGEQVQALPLAERDGLANTLAGKLEAPQLLKLEPAFGRERIAAAVADRAGPEVREAYAAGAETPSREEGGGLLDTLREWVGLGTKPRDDTQQISATVTNPDSGEINDVSWTVDAEGRPIHAEGTLRTVFSEIERSDAETQAQRTAADRGVDGDQGGHVFGHRFVTDQGMKNLFPQNGNFNMGAYKTLENEWAAWVDKGMEVQISIELTPHNVDRPDQVRISYEVIDPADGDRVYDQRVSFENRAGQQYDRVETASMDDMIATHS